MNDFRCIMIMILTRLRFYICDAVLGPVQNSSTKKDTKETLRKFNRRGFLRGPSCPSWFMRLLDLSVLA